jgi:hypothetical protein
MTFLIFALSQNGARRNDVFNGFPFSSANPKFIDLINKISLLIIIISMLSLKARHLWNNLPRRTESKGEIEKWMQCTTTTFK